MVYGVNGYSEIAPITLPSSMDSFHITVRYNNNDLDDRPFPHPTGSVAKHISSIGLKIHIIMNDSDILSKVGSYHSSPFHVLSHVGNI